VNFIPKQSIDGAICKNIFYFHIFSFWFSSVILTEGKESADFTRISALNRASDDVTN